MALTDNGSDFTMPVAPLYGGGNNGFGFGGDSGWWLILLFLFAFNGGWGNGFGGNAMPYVVNNDVQRGFDQSAIMSSLTGINNAITSGFATAELGRATANTDLLQTLWGIQSQQQACCCENRGAIADLKYTVATENCADRQALSDGVRDIIASQTAGIQTILDKMCSLELDAKNDKIADLERQLAMASLSASQVQQTATLIQNNAMQTELLRPTPIPAYIVANPNAPVVE